MQPAEATRPGGVLATGRLDLAGPGLLAVAVLAALPLFQPGLTGLASAWSRPEFSHGPIIPLLSFWLFLRELKGVPPVPEPVADRWPGVAVIGLALALALAGRIARIDNLIFYALILWVAGLLLTGFGWTRGRGFWPSVLHLVFMLPLPQVLYWEVSTTLQMLSSRIGVWMLGLGGVPVYLDGNVIDLGVYRLMVAEACSGLRYLFPIMSFTYVFAVLYRGPGWHKAGLLLTAVPLAVLMNALRIGIIGLLVDRNGIGAAEGFLHAFEGWVVFLACIGLMVLAAKGLQWLSGDRRRLADTLMLDVSGLGAQAARGLATPATPALTGAAGLTLLVTLGFLLAPARDLAPPPRADFAAFPLEIAGWQGTPTTLAPGVARMLEADDHLGAIYRTPEGEAVDLFLSWYGDQTIDRAIHSPEVCLPGAGWEVAAIARVTVALPGTATGTVTLNRAVIQKGLTRQLVWYWFAGRGRQETSDTAAKLHMLADGLRRGRTDGGLVRLVTPIAAGRTGDASGEAAAERAAEARLQAFLAATVDRLPVFIPD